MDNVYWTTLYTNYVAFNEKSPKCVLKTIKFQNDKYAKQMALACYGREIAVPVDKELENYTFYDDIWIYPEINNTMMVLQCIPNTTKQCILLEKYENVRWRQFPVARESIFRNQVPTSITDKNKVYDYIKSNIAKLSFYYHKYVSFFVTVEV